MLNFKAVSSSVGVNGTPQGLRDELIFKSLQICRLYSTSVLEHGRRRKKMYHKMYCINSTNVFKF